MNCTKCKDNLYMTEDTQSCYKGGINHYYLDNNDKILRRCHQNCLQCNNGPINDTYMKCTLCQEKLYMTEDTESCYENGVNNYYLDNKDNILKRCHPNCLQCINGPNNDTYMNYKKCQNNFYITEDTYSCYNYIKNNYYLDKYILRRCYSRCANYLGAKNDVSMNCLGCKNDEYFYKADTNDCILKEDYTKRKNLEFSRTSDYNFYIFIFISVASLIIFIIICIIMRKKNNNNEQGNQQLNGE